MLSKTVTVSSNSGNLSYVLFYHSVMVFFSVMSILNYKVLTKTETLFSDPTMSHEAACVKENLITDSFNVT